MMLIKVLLFAVLLLLSRSVKVQCEYEPSSWQAQRKFKISQREALVPTIYGLDIIVDDWDGVVSKEIQNRGHWQPRNVRAMSKFVKEGSSILNIGAHVGLQAIVLAEKVGPKGKLYIFEPTELTYQILVKNIYLNQLEEITTVYKMGASDKLSVGISEIRLANTGGSQIKTANFTKKISPDVTYEQVILDRADKILPKAAVIDFALIDTQKMELQVMEGLKETIARSPNLVIMCEWWAWLFLKEGKGARLRALLTWMQDHGYKFFYLGPSQGHCEDVRFIPQSLEQAMQNQIQFNDIFYVPAHIDPNSL